MKTTNIRKANNRDIPELKNLMTTYIVDFYKRDEPNAVKLEQLIITLLENHDTGIQFVAECEGKLVGFATIYMSYSTLNVKRQATLNDLYVDEQYRTYGIGESLTQACIFYCKEKDCSSMILETAVDNKKAQRLYNKLGGQISGWVHYEFDF